MSDFLHRAAFVADSLSSSSLLSARLVYLASAFAFRGFETCSDSLFDFLEIIVCFGLRCPSEIERFCSVLDPFEPRQRLASPIPSESASLRSRSLG